MVPYPSTDTAFGIWSLNEIRDARRGDNWPGLPSVTITRSVTSVDEGDTVTFTIDTEFIPDTTTLYYDISGMNITASDFSDSTLSDSFTVTNGSATISKTIAEDNTTEGTETFTFNVRLDSTSGKILASTLVNINDTSIELPVTTASILVIAGGGAGGGDGNNGGGGGGAGGYVYHKNRDVSNDVGSTFAITVGSGGVGDIGQGDNGEDSSFQGLTTAVGGGGGGTQDSSGSSGGSGGGAGGGGGGTPLGGDSVTNQGKDGGDRGPYGSPFFVGGGGGGAREEGGLGGNANDASGGDGFTIGTHSIYDSESSTNESINLGNNGDSYCGGGGGARKEDSSDAPGGLGGGGDGVNDSDTGPGGDGTRPGAGGGGGRFDIGGSGADGIVIIKLDAQAAGTTGSPTITNDSGSYTYVFTQSGSITF